MEDLKPSSQFFPNHLFSAEKSPKSVEIKLTTFIEQESQKNVKKQEQIIPKKALITPKTVRVFKIKKQSNKKAKQVKFSQNINENVKEKTKNSLTTNTTILSKMSTFDDNNYTLKQSKNSFISEIPSFLNDKNFIQRSELRKIMNFAKKMKQLRKIHNISNELKLLNDFGKGLFDTKQDFNNGEDLDVFFVSSKKNEAKRSSFEYSESTCNDFIESSFEGNGCYIGVEECSLFNLD